MVLYAKVRWLLARTRNILAPYVNVMLLLFSIKIDRNNTTRLRTDLGRSDGVTTVFQLV